MIFNEGLHNKNWKTKKLIELGSFGRGVSKHRPRNDKLIFENGNHPFIQTGDVKSANLYIDSHSENYNNLGLKQSKIWPKETLCITIAANIAETALLGYPMCFPDSIVGFNAYSDKTSELFMHYVFTYIRKSIQNSASGSIQDNINIDYLKNLNFKIPTKEYQDKIVRILSNLDKKIDLNNKINQELEEMVKIIYDYWFVQFDFPDENGKPYKSSGGEMFWSEELKREIPVGWEVKKLEDLVSVNKKKYDTKDSEPKKMIDLSVMPSKTFCLNRFNSSDAFETNHFYMEKYDILFGSIRPYLLKCGFSPIDGVVAGTVHSFKVKSENDFNLIINVFTSDNLFSYADKKSEGTKMPVIKNNVLLDYKLPYNKMISNKFNDYIKFKEIISNKIQENQELESLRDWLLPLLMNGQVSIK